MTTEQKQQLSELLRLTALALGDGWSTTEFTSGEFWLCHSEHEWRQPHADDGDSRRLECELGIGTEFITHGLGFPCVIALKKTPYVLTREQFNHHNNNRQAATCWAVLRCAAEIGRTKERANAN